MMGCSRVERRKIQLKKINERLHKRGERRDRWLRELLLSLSRVRNSDLGPPISVDHL